MNYETCAMKGTIAFLSPIGPTPRTAMTKCAVLHDGTIHPGGGAKVAIEACRALDADLYVGFSGVDDDWWDQRTPHDVTVLTERASETGQFVRDVLLVRHVLALDLRGYDVVLTSGPLTKFYQPYDNQRRVHYMHHPPLFSLWYDGGLVHYALKALDKLETRSLPTILTNSELTADRLRTHYGRDADQVVYPPVEVERFESDRLREDATFVMVGRLEDRKRSATAVEAFRRVGAAELHLLGDGPLREELEADAPPNVTFHGYVSDETLTDWLERAYAGVFLARREDFGITPIEYQAAGLPVVGVDEPNTNNQIDERTGRLVPPKPSAVADGIRDVLSTDWDRTAIAANAERYSTDRFHREIQEAVL